MRETRISIFELKSFALRFNSGAAFRASSARALTTAMRPSAAKASAPTRSASSGCSTNNGPPTRTPISRLHECRRTTRISDASRSMKRSELREKPAMANHCLSTKWAISSAESIWPPETSQPSRRKKASTTNKPNVCCSPGVARSSARRPCRAFRSLASRTPGSGRATSGATWRDRR